jgi:hypothetical protein
LTQKTYAQLTISFLVNGAISETKHHLITTTVRELVPFTEVSRRIAVVDPTFAPSAFF